MDGSHTPALLARSTRGGIEEVLVRGHVAVVDADGSLLASAGDPMAETTLRSAVKPLQALAFLESGAAGACEDPAAAVAIACGSHRGEPEHVATVWSMLASVGSSEDELECGPAFPSDRRAREAAIVAGAGPQRVYHNCSGKHASMVALARHRGWEVAGYCAPAHAVQAAVRECFRAHAGIDLATAPVAIDGCGVPTWALPLRELAAGMARAAAASESFAAAVLAMRTHPQLVAGSDAFDTLLLMHSPQGLAGKSGAAGIWVGVSLPRRVAVAVKLEAGVGSYLAPVVLAALDQLGLLGDDVPDALRDLMVVPVSNSRAEVVGCTEAAFDLR